MSEHENAGAEAAARPGWLARLRAGLGRTSSKLVEGIGGLFAKKRLDQATLDELEALLIGADLGVAVAGRLVGDLARQKFGREVTDEEVRTAFADDIARVLAPVAEPLAVDPARRPSVVLVVGVNGSGKTTTIGKLAKQQRDRGLKVMLAAGDTFRAAAIEQLRIWGERTGCPVVARPQGSDAAALAFEAIEQARRDGADLLLVDTAGRLQNKSDLMAELAKVVRVMRKVDPSAPHEVLLVLDGTVGQNAHSQVKAFREMVDVSGLVVTKLDGTAKGGVVVALAEAFGLPIRAVGVGESAEDLRPFEARAFARSLMGLPS